ncbi:MAG: DUF6011 domain-containing protein [Ornithinimicrobium sp.]
MTPRNDEARPAGSGTGSKSSGGDNTLSVAEKPSCCVCARPITARRSVARGMGPKCAGAVDRRDDSGTSPLERLTALLAVELDDVLGIRLPLLTLAERAELFRGLADAVRAIRHAEQTAQRRGGWIA